MSRVQTRCPNCRKAYRVPESRLGEQVQCRKCSQTFTLRMAAHETANTTSEGSKAVGLQNPSALPAAMPLPTEPKAAPATVPTDRFKILGELGSGAFGTVHKARDTQLDRLVALKTPRLGVLGSEADAQRFLREARAAGNLRHPNIVPIYDAGRMGESYFIASGFIEGQTLAECLGTEERPSRREAVVLIQKLALALHYAHGKGVVHRDMKPANVMLDTEGEPLVLDFGMARRDEGDVLRTMEGAHLGTPAYMSPEQHAGQSHLADARSDQWALGVMLYEMLAGRRPFEAPSVIQIAYLVRETEPEKPSKLQKGIPKDLETIVLKCLQKEPDERYASCQHLAEDLGRWLRDEPIAARPIGQMERCWRWCRRNPLPGALGCAVLLLALLSTIAALGLFQSRRQLTRALHNERQQTEIARNQSRLAAEQTHYAQEQERLANESAKSAKDSEEAAEEQKRIAQDALANLRREIGARTAAETTIRTDAEKRSALDEEIKKRDTELATQANAVKDSEKTAQEAIASTSWAKYTEKLAAADAAYQDKQNDRATELLVECPEEHRAWEWYYLKSIFGGLQPAENRDTLVPSNSVIGLQRRLSATISFNAQWLFLNVSVSARIEAQHLGLPENGIYELPGLRLQYSVRRDRDMDVRFVSPDGRFLLLRTDRQNWELFDIARGRRLSDKIQSVHGPMPFSPDGSFALFDDMLFSLHTMKPVINPDPPKLHPHLTVGARVPVREYSSFTPMGQLVGFGDSTYHDNMVGRVKRVLIGIKLCTIDSKGMPEWGSSTSFTIARTTPPTDGNSFYEVYCSNNSKCFAALRFPDDPFRKTRTGHVGRRFGDKTPIELCLVAVSPPRFLYQYAALSADGESFLALSPDGRRLVIHRSGFVRLLDTAQQRELPVLRSLPWNDIQADEVVIAPDWSRVVMVEKGTGKLYYWSIPKPLDLGAMK